MKTKSFKDVEDALRYAHSCQQGGHNNALVIKKSGFIVCPWEETFQYKGPSDHVEYLEAAPQ